MVVACITIEVKTRSLRRALFCVIAVNAALGGAAEKPSVAVAQLVAPPEVDGIIDEGEWQEAAVFDGHFVQFEPEFGSRSPFRTSIRIAQTETALYLAVEAFDPDHWPRLETP